MMAGMVELRGAEVKLRRVRQRLSALAACLMVGTGAYAIIPLSFGGAQAAPMAKPATTGLHRYSSEPGRPATGRRRSAPTTSVPPLHRIPPGPPADERRLVEIDSIGGPISPKSVDASGTGFVFAQNMMYRHTITVYSSAGKLLKTISDGVDMAAFGFPGHPGLTRGAPVEAAFSPDAKYAYVSNYSMYGVGMGPEGSDECTPASARAAGDTNSYVYRISTSTLSIDQVIEVGLVPKFLAVSPDDKYLLVANWCSWDLGVVDIATGKEVARIPMGPYPRGIAISPDSSTAYVAIMGGYDVVTVSLRTLTRTGEFYVGYNPRHVVINPTGRYMYVSLNAPGDVVKVDLATRKVVETVHTGADCRSLAISTDGTALYVDNYLSDTITVLRASDLAVLQTLPTGVNPVGITYDPVTGNVWVAVYTGQLLVFADR
jgi:YVTN family beta-propeller protein